MEADGRWWKLIDVGGRWWMLMDVGGSWWMLMDVGGRWWTLMDVGGRWWMLVDVGGRWWTLMDVGGRWLWQDWASHLSVAGSFSDLCVWSRSCFLQSEQTLSLSLFWSLYNFPHASLKCASHSPRLQSVSLRCELTQVVHPFEAQVCFSSGLFWVSRQFFLRLTSPSADVGWQQQGEWGFLRLPEAESVQIKIYFTAELQN